LNGSCSTGYHDDGSGACVKNQFINGPCVTSADLSALEIYATSGQRIYRRVISGSSTGSWANVSTLDASKLDTRSDLDCTAGSDAVHVVATGKSPIGAAMHAFGFGGSFNDFTREVATEMPSTFSLPGMSIAVWMGSTDTRYQLAGAAGNPAWYFIQSSTLTTSFSPSALYAMTSNPDIAIKSTPDAAHFMLVAYMHDQMVYHDYYFGRGTGWEPSVLQDPPSGTAFSYAPTICATNYAASSTDYTRYVAAVANGKLYVANTGVDWSVSPVAFTAWATAGTATPASSPDCVVTSDGTVHIVMVTSTGTVARIYRKGTGSWTTQDLGTF
jgi:hypothetical protein